MNDDNHTKQAFAELIKTTAEVYGRDVSQKLLAVYFAALRRYDLADVQRALNLHLQNPDSGQFMPKPADIVRAIDGGIETRALEAWTQVSKAVSSVGPWQSVVFDDAITMAVIEEMGGWIQVCKVTDKELPFMGAEFQKRHRGHSGRGGAKSHPRLLVGLSQAANEAAGQPVSPPKLIGDAVKAKVLLESGSARSGLLVTKAEDAG